jgi:hypothetical protein
MNRSRRRSGRVSEKRLKTGAGLTVGCSKKRWHNQLFVTDNTIRGDEDAKTSQNHRTQVYTPAVGRTGKPKMEIPDKAKR